MFRPSLGHFQALLETGPRTIHISMLPGSQMHLGSGKALEYREFLDLFLRGPEDEPVKVETCRSDNILYCI